MNQSENDRCYQKALSHLARRALSSYNLRKKLKENFSDEAIEHSLTKLIEKKYLDDQQYLQRKWDSAKKQGMGNLNRKRKMLQEGFNKETLNTLTKDCDNDNEEIQNALDYLERRKKNLVNNLESSETKEKIWRHLCYKGHSFAIIEKIWKILTSQINH